MRLKQILLTYAVIAFMAAFPAQAEELQIGCYPKAELLSKLQENRQSQIGQMMLKSKSAAKKATLTAAHNGKGYMHNGRGYLIESTNGEACIIARMRIDPGPEKNQLTISTLHTFDKQEFTSEEWKKLAQHAAQNAEKARKDYIAKGYTEDEVNKAMEVIAILSKNRGLPNQVDAKFIYQVMPDGNLKRISEEAYAPY